MSLLGALARSRLGAATGQGGLRASELAGMVAVPTVGIGALLASQQATNPNLQAMAPHRQRMSALDEQMRRLSALEALELQRQEAAMRALLEQAQALGLRRSPQQPDAGMNLSALMPSAPNARALSDVLAPQAPLDGVGTIGLDDTGYRRTPMGWQR